MIKYALYKLNGQYVVSGTSRIELQSIDIPEGQSVYYGEVNILTQYHDISTGLPTLQGTPPAGDGYRFNFDTKAWEPDTPYLIYKTKGIRDQLLLNSDWTDTLSAKNRLGQERYDQWQTYRQALRDITTQSTYPINVVWPTPPQ